MRASVAACDCCVRTRWVKMPGSERQVMCDLDRGWREQFPVNHGGWRSWGRSAFALRLPSDGENKFNAYPKSFSFFLRETRNALRLSQCLWRYAYYLVRHECWKCDLYPKICCYFVFYSKARAGPRHKQTKPILGATRTAGCLFGWTIN